MSDVEAGGLVRRILQKRDSIILYHRVSLKIVRSEHTSGQFAMDSFGEYEEFSLGNVDVMSTRHAVCMPSRHTCFC